MARAGAMRQSFESTSFNLPCEVAVNDNAVEAVVDERKQVSEQPGEQFHGHPHEARSDAKSHQAWTGPADRGRQEFSSGR